MELHSISPIHGHQVIANIPSIIPSNNTPNRLYAFFDTLDPTFDSALMDLSEVAFEV